MILQGQDGEMRVSDFGLTGVTHYLEILFCEMDFSGPVSRPRPEETLHMNRNKFDSDAHYTLGPDTPRYEPIPVTFSFRVDDTTMAAMISDFFSGVTIITSGASVIQLYSFKGNSAGIDGNTLPDFADNTAKYAYRLEMLWDGTNDYGVRYEEVYFPPGEQTIAEAADSLILNINGQVYGDVTRVTAFSSGYTLMV